MRWSSGGIAEVGIDLRRMITEDKVKGVQRRLLDLCHEHLVSLCPYR